MSEYLSGKFFIWALLVAIIGGVVSYALGMVFSPIQALPWGMAITGVLVFVLLAYLSKYSSVDQEKIFGLLMILILVGALGTMIASIVPAAAAFILTLGGNFTWLGLGFTLIYIMIADAVIEKMM